MLFSACSYRLLLPVLFQIVDVTPCSRSFVSMLLLCSLFATCSLAVVLFLILCLQSHFGRLLFRGSSGASPMSPLSKVPLRDHWFAVDARAPRHCSLQQSVLLSVRLVHCLHRTGGLQHHCAILWAVSTTEAFIAATCRCVIVVSVRHRWLVVDPRLFLVCERIVPKWSTISVVYLLPNLLLLCVRSVPFSLCCSFSLSQNFLSAMHAGCSPTILNCARSRLSAE